MSAPHGYGSLASQGRWRRTLMLAMVPMICLALVYAYSSSYTVVDAKGTPALKGSDSQHKRPPPPMVSSIQPQPDHHVSQHASAATTALTAPAALDTSIAPTEAAHSTPAAAPKKAKPSPAPPSQKGEDEDVDLSMANIIRALYRPVLHPVDATNFTDEEGKTFRLPGPPRFTSNLGKKVLILDVDSRPLTGEGQLMDEDLKWRGMRPLSAGMLSHYMYAQIHGYDYKFIQAPDYPDRWGTWVKVPMMREALKTHDYIVFMDSDVMFHYPHLPLEWLLNYWGMSEDALVMMSVDPDEPQNYDQMGNRFLNTGFVIAQRSERTMEMYKAWAECPSETRYKGCGRWKNDWPHEQSAFGNHLRYDFDRPEDIRVLPCAEANGAPEAINRGGCKGTFVRHFWVDKGLLAKGLADSVMQYFLPRLHKAYLNDAEEHIWNKKGFKLQGAELIELSDKEKEEAKNSEGKNQKDEGYKKKAAVPFEEAKMEAKKKFAKPEQTSEQEPKQDSNQDEAKKAAASSQSSEKEKPKHSTEESEPLAEKVKPAARPLAEAPSHP